MHKYTQGDKYKETDADLITYGINEDDHANKIEVHGDKELRDEILRSLILSRKMMEGKNDLTEEDTDEDIDYNHFLKWYKTNESRFYCGQFDERQIALSAFYEGQKHTEARLRALIEYFFISMPYRDLVRIQTGLKVSKMKDSGVIQNNTEGKE
jgi:hypothetical protein